LQSYQQFVEAKLNREMKLKLILLVFIFYSFCCQAQKPFVFFETTTKKNEVCQGKTIGVIATINSQIENYISYKWSGDSKDVQEANNEIVIVNTSEPGEKRLKFSLVIDHNLKYDTIFTVKVLAKPDILLKNSGKILSIKNDKGLILSGFMWKYNGELLVDEKDSILRNPNKGTFQVFVIDNNGCRNSSQIITVE